MFIIWKHLIDYFQVDTFIRKFPPNLPSIVILNFWSLYTNNAQYVVYEEKQKRNDSNDNENVIVLQHHSRQGGWISNMTTNTEGKQIQRGWKWMAPEWRPKQRSFLHLYPMPFSGCIQVTDCNGGVVKILQAMKGSF